MLKKKPTRIFCYWGAPTHDLNKDIDVRAITNQFCDVAKWYVGTRVPATKHITVSGFCTQFCLLQQLVSVLVDGELVDFYTV